MPTMFGPAVGPVLPLRAQLHRYPDLDIVVQHRMSSYSNAGPGKAKLRENTDALVAEIERAAPGRHIRAVFMGVESGRLTARRPTLHRAIEAATAGSMSLLVAADLSRFIRSAAYDRRRNPGAIPTKAELARLREMAGGVPLATLAQPTLAESARHSLATLRSGKAGRPSEIDDALATAIFGELEYYSFTGSVWRFARPISGVAAEFGVSPASIYRAMQRPGPLPGMTWGQWLAIEGGRRGKLGL